MKVLILAGGYGTRLQRDLENDTSGHYKELIGLPKALLPIGSKPLASHILDNLRTVSEVSSSSYVVTNDAYFESFTKWSEGYPEVEVVSDGSTNNENRLGSIGSIEYAIKTWKIEGDSILIIASDTLLYDDFSLESFITQFHENKQEHADASLVVTCQCTEEETWKRGIVEVDSDGKVTSFLEKVGPSKTTSRLAVPCFYLLSKTALALLAVFLEERKDAPMAQRDAPGHFIKYLSERMPVFTFKVSGRFDVGSLAFYKECNEYFEQKERQNLTSN